MFFAYGVWCLQLKHTISTFVHQTHFQHLTQLIQLYWYQTDYYRMLLPVYQKIKYNHNCTAFSQYFSSSPFPFKVCRNKRHFFLVSLFGIFQSRDSFLKMCSRNSDNHYIFKHYKMLCWLGVWKKTFFATSK